MKKQYEHRPGLFGLASIAAGCAKNREDRNEEKLTVSSGHNQMQSQSRSQPVRKKSNHSRRGGNGAGL
jgi:hypothetical protein